MPSPYNIEEDDEYGIPGNPWDDTEDPVAPQKKPNLFSRINQKINQTPVIGTAKNVAAAGLGFGVGFVRNSGWKRVGLIILGYVVGLQVLHLLYWVGITYSLPILAPAMVALSWALCAVFVAFLITLVCTKAIQPLYEKAIKPCIACIKDLISDARQEQAFVDVENMVVPGMPADPAVEPPVLRRRSANPRCTVELPREASAAAADAPVPPFVPPATPANEPNVVNTFETPNEFAPPVAPPIDPANTAHTMDTLELSNTVRPSNIAPPSYADSVADYPGQQKQFGEKGLASNARIQAANKGGKGRDASIMTSGRPPLRDGGPVRGAQLQVRADVHIPPPSARDATNNSTVGDNIVPDNIMPQPHSNAEARPTLPGGGG